MFHKGSFDIHFSSDYKYAGRLVKKWCHIEFNIIATLSDFWMRCWFLRLVPYKATYSCVDRRHLISPSRLRQWQNQWIEVEGFCDIEVFVSAVVHMIDDFILRHKLYQLLKEWLYHISYNRFIVIRYNLLLDLEIYDKTLKLGICLRN